MNNLIKEIAKLINHNGRARTTILVLASCVVFITTYMLILPAFTLERDEAVRQGGIELSADRSNAEEKTDAVDIGGKSSDRQSDDQYTTDGSAGAEKADGDDESGKASDSKTSSSGDANATKQKSVKQEAAADKPESSGADDSLLTYEGKDYSIEVKDSESILPEDTELKVEEIDKSSKKNKERYNELYERALDAVRSEKGGSGTGSLSFAYFYDISLMSGGEEIEPDKPVDVTVSYESAIKNVDKDHIRVIHISEEEKGGEKTGELEAEVVDPEKVDAVVKNNKLSGATFTADSFSVYAIVYTVDFHYEVNGKMYDFSISGGGFVSFTDLVEVLGIAKQDGTGDFSGEVDAENNENDGNSDDEFAGEVQGVDALDALTASEFVSNVANVEFSDESLIQAAQITDDITAQELKEQLGVEPMYSAELTDAEISENLAQKFYAPDWVLVSLKAFDTEETLTVTMKNGDVFVIKVTDAAQRKTITFAVSPSGWGAVRRDETNNSTNSFTLTHTDSTTIILNPDQTTTYRSSWNVSNTNRFDYLFAGWTYNGHLYTNLVTGNNNCDLAVNPYVDDNVEDNSTLTAHFYPKSAKVVLFDTEDGTDNKGTVSSNVYFFGSSEDGNAANVMPTASAASGYQFKGWYDGETLISHNPTPTTDELNGLTSGTVLRARFEEQAADGHIDFTINVYPGEGGTVTISGQTGTSVIATTKTGSDNAGTNNNTITANAANGGKYEFDYWRLDGKKVTTVTGNVINPGELYVGEEGTHTLTAVFKATGNNYHTVSFKSNNGNYGVVRYIDEKSEEHGGGTGILTLNTDATGKVLYTIMPAARRGYIFDHWEDENGNTYSVFEPSHESSNGIQPTVFEDGIVYTAVFIENPDKEVFVANGNIVYEAGEHGSVSKENGKKSDAVGAVAKPDSGYVFWGWFDEKGNAVYPYSTYKPVDITDNPDKVIAQFKPISELSNVRINYVDQKVNNQYYGNIKLNNSYQYVYSTVETINAGGTAVGCTAYVDTSNDTKDADGKLVQGNYFGGWYEINGNTTKLVSRDPNFKPEGYLIKNSTYYAYFRPYKSGDKSAGGIVSYNMNLAGVEVTWNDTADFMWMTNAGGMAFAYLNNGTYWDKNDIITITDVVPTAPGYKFIGWFDKNRKKQVEAYYKKGQDPYNQKEAHLRKAGDKVQFLYTGLGQRYTFEAVWVKIDTEDKIVPYDEASHSLKGTASIIGGSVSADGTFAKEFQDAVIGEGYIYDKTTGQFRTDEVYTLKKVNGESVLGTVAETSFSQILPGEYEIEVSSSGNFNGQKWDISKPAKLTILPKTITVVKNWDDDNNGAETRPDNLIVKLGKDKGVPGLLEPTVSSWKKEGNIWTATYTNLPFKAEGEVINYSAVEAHVPKGYTQIGDTKKATTQAYADIFEDPTLTNDTFTITNKLTTIKDSDPLEVKIHKQDKNTSEAMKKVGFILSGGAADITGNTDDDGDLTLTIPKTDLGIWQSEAETKTFTLSETTPENYQAAGPWTITVKSDGTREEINNGVTTIYYKWKVESIGELTGKDDVYTIENEMSVGSLMITKNVTFNNREATSDDEKGKLNGEYKFSVRKNNVEISGSPFTITVTNGVSNSVLIPNLEPGEDYTIEESDAGSLTLKAASGGTGVDTEKIVTATVTAGKTTETDLLDSAKAVFINNYLEYKVTIVKVDTGNTSLRLGGAVFDLYDEEAVNADSLEIINGKTPLQSGLTTVASGSSKGTVSLGSLKPGIYYLFETQAPDGYNVMDKPVKITIADGRVSLMQGTRNQEGSIEQEQTELIVMNSAGIALPSTGGPGTRLFTILGSILVCIAGVSLLWKKRRMV